MSLLLPVELDKTPSGIQIPRGSGFIPIYHEPLPTNVQAGESWSFNRISAQFRTVLIEKEREKAEETDTNYTKYSTGEEIEKALENIPVFEEEHTSAGINQHYEKKATTYTWTPEIHPLNNRLKREATTITERSIFPCDTAALIELVDQQDTICSMTLDNTFRWYELKTEKYFGQCEFSGYLDLTNPIPIYTEQITLRISIFVALSVPAETLLESITGPAGYVNLIYDKEVK